MSHSAAKKRSIARRARGVGGRRQQDQDVDVGMREQLAAAVAADGDQRAARRGIADSLQTPRNDAVDEARMLAQQPRRVGVGEKRVAQRVAAARELVAPVRDPRLRRARQRRSASRGGATMPCRALTISAGGGGGVPADSVSTSKPSCGDEHRVLPLRRQRVVGGDDRPAVGEAADARPAGVDHRLDR